MRHLRRTTNTLPRQRDARLHAHPLRASVCVLLMCVVALLELRGGLAEDSPPALERLDGKRIVSILSDKAAPEHTKVTQFASLLRERSEIWRSVRDGRLRDSQSSYLRTGDYRYLIDMICFRAPPRGDPRPLPSIQEGLGRAPPDGDRIYPLALRVALVLAGSRAEEDVSRCIAVARMVQPDAPEDLVALAMEALQGICPPDLVPALLRALASSWYGYEMRGRLRYTLREAAAPRLRELGLPLASRQEPDPLAPGTDKTREYFVMEPAALVAGMREWLNSGDLARVRGGVAIARDVEWPLVQSARQELQSDPHLPDQVKKAIATDAAK